jgi:hypothetical protein
MGDSTLDRLGRRWPALLLVVALALGVAPVSGAVNFAITSDDGVRLALGPNGTVENVKLGDRGLGMVGDGGFSIRGVGGMPNLVPNASFEADADADGVPDGWSAVTSPTAPVLDAAVSRVGSRSVRIGRSTFGDSGYLRREVRVRANTEYTVSAWMRSAGVQPTAPPGLTYTELSPVRMMVQQFAGTKVVHTGYLFGYTDTADWNRQFLGIRTTPDTTSVRLTLRLIRGSGTIWFDEIRVSELLSSTSLPVRGAVTRVSPSQLRQHAELPGEQLTLDADFVASQDRITVDATVRSTAATDRPLQVAYTLPIDAVGWQWQRHGRRSSLIAAGQTYAYDTRWHVQAMSRYPWSTINDAASALSIGLPLDMPRVARARYGPEGLTITFDLGLSPRATLLGNAATFRFVLFASDPEWGFRASTEKYYRLYPEAFVRRTDPTREGGWVQRRYLGEWADNMADFGLGLDMLALGNDQDGAEQNDADLIPADNAEGVYTVGYNHHWGYKYRLPSRDSRPPYEQAVEWLEAQAAGPRDTASQIRTSDKARAALVSTARDYNGRLVYERYADKFLQWYLNLDPMPSKEIDSGRAGHLHQVLNSIANGEAAGTLDGIHFDSTSGMRRWGEQDDYSRAHWAVAPVPLTFSYDSGQVALRIAFTDFGQIEREADFLHDRGMILTANFNGSEARAGAWFGAHKIDYMGIEQGLPEKTGEGDIYVTQDGFALFKRTLAYQRPVTTLDPLLGAGLLSTAEVHRRLKLNLFYGIYAGIGAKAGALTEEIRQLYLRYVPIFREVNTAGWEPVTKARSADRAVWLERFGDLDADGAVYLAVRDESIPNGTATPQPYTVTVDLGDWTPAAELVGRELVDDQAVAVVVGADGQATFSGTLGPQDTDMVRLTRP